MGRMGRSYGAANSVERAPTRPTTKPTSVAMLLIRRRSSELWLRNSAKCPRNFGRRGAIYCHHPCGGQRWVAAETSEKRLFTKNTGPCEVVRRCIRTDACPVLER